MNYQVELVPDREITANVEEPFDWEKFLELCGSYPCNFSPLFTHTGFMDSVVSEIVLAPDKFVFIRTGENGTRPAKIETTYHDNVYVDFQDVSYLDRESFSIYDIVMDQEEFDELFKNFVGDRIPPDFVSVAEMNMYKEHFDTHIKNMIKPGQFFELQEEINPRKVTVAEVLENHGGIVVYRNAGVEQVQVLHMASPFCHAIGWAATDAQTASYCVEYTEKEMQRFRENSVPDIVFEHFTPTEHQFQLGHLVEVLDPLEGQYVSPGYVSQIVNKHYAIVKYYGPTKVEPKQILIHRFTRGIYPAGSSQSRGFIFALPKAMEKTPFTWANFKVMTKQFTGSAMPDSAVLPMNRRKVPSMQYIEVFSYEKGVMTSGLITRSQKDTIYLSLGYNPNGRTYSQRIGSFNIFPVGFAAKHGIPFYAEPPFYTLADIGEEDECRFELTRHFRPVPGPVFRKFSYSGRGRPEKKWNFMPVNWLRGDKWLPPVYIRRTCKVGEWIDAKLFSQLHDSYSAGPMPMVVEQIVKDVYKCTKSVYRYDISSVMDTDGEMPVIVVKHRWRAENVAIRVPIPEEVKQFPGWIRMFLKCIGCCPSLLTLVPDKDDECADGCGDMVEVEPVVPSTSFPSPQKRVSTGEGRGGSKKKSKKDEAIRAELGLPVGRGKGRHSSSTRKDFDTTLPSDYNKWTHLQIVDYLIRYNPGLKKIGSNLLFKDLTSAQLLAFKDESAVMQHGFSQRDAKRILAALNRLRSTFNKVSSK